MDKAEQDPQDDLVFRHLETYTERDSVTEAASKLNLDSDKINAASLFWFYKGNAIVDEPAFRP